MSDLSNQAQKLLGRFHGTVFRMKLGYSKNDKMMSVWADDLYAVEAVMSFLETIRDAPAQSGQNTATKTLKWIADQRWDEDADLDHICTAAEKALALFPSPGAAEQVQWWENQCADLMRKNEDLVARVEGAITTFKAIYAKTPHPDIAEMAFNAIQTLSSTSCTQDDGGERT